MSLIVGLLTAFGLLAMAILGIAAVVMPLVVILLDHRVSKIQQSLHSIEDIMRNGKQP